MEKRRLDPYCYLPPDGKPVDPEMTFQVTHYSIVDRYILVGWRYGSKNTSEVIAGESLYEDLGHKNIKLLDSDGGQIPLYTQAPDMPTQTPRHRPKVWDRMDSRIGSHGIPPAIAIALRDPANRVYPT